jgi:hypothetical protein
MRPRSPQSLLGLGLALAALLGCSQSARARLDGRWQGERFESLDGSVSAGRAGWARGTSLGFSGAVIRVQLPGEPPRSGTYTVVSDVDGQLELSITGHDGHIDRTELTLETDELLRWHLTDVHTLVMRRE